MMATAKRSSNNKKPPVLDDPLMSCREAGMLVNRSHTTIIRWINEGLLRCERDPSGSRRIRRSELVRFYGATAMSDLRPISEVLPSDN